ncbi:hypothetical protein D770_05300 [Flammeovirgaceae bacterium 311]|nr:hypothetical protein D770_05300 [Flammeovirgaceae bacterium 311]
MIVLKTSPYIKFICYFFMAMGVVMFYYFITETDWARVKDQPEIAVASIILLFSLFYLLPLIVLRNRRVLKLSGSTLLITKRYSVNVRTYDLENLKKWYVETAKGRYSYGRILYLQFRDGNRLYIQEMEFANFDALLSHFVNNNKLSKMTKK